MSLSSDNNGKNHSPCYALKAKPLNARPVDAKRCRSGRACRKARDGETKTPRSKSSQLLGAADCSQRGAKIIAKTLYFQTPFWPELHAEIKGRRQRREGAVLMALAKASQENNIITFLGYAKKVAFKHFSLQVLFFTLAAGLCYRKVAFKPWTKICGGPTTAQTGFQPCNCGCPQLYHGVFHHLETNQG